MCFRHQAADGGFLWLETNTARWVSEFISGAEMKYLMASGQNVKFIVLYIHFIHMDGKVTLYDVFSGPAF